MTTRRPSAREDQLERENKFLRDDLARVRQDPGDIPMTGCGDGSCIVARPTGMHTNGGCRCDERRLRQAAMWWRRRAQFLVETVRELRTQVVPGDATAVQKIVVAAQVWKSVRDEASPALTSSDKWTEPLARAIKALHEADAALDDVTGWSGGSGHWGAQELHPKVRAALEALGEKAK